MFQYCYYCGEELEHHHWRTKKVETERGEQWVDICGKHVRPIKKEWIPQRIKDERRGEHFKDIIQPRRNGQASREFVETYPKQAQKMFDKKEIEKSDYVWKDLPGHKEHFG